MADGSIKPTCVVAVVHLGAAVPQPVRIYRPNGGYSIATGHPPPWQQILGQIRTPTGFTFGTASTISLPSQLETEMEKLRARVRASAHAASAAASPEAAAARPKRKNAGGGFRIGERERGPQS